MTYTLHCGDCLDILPTLADNSIDLIATDPPYYKVKGEQWDRQWETPESFLAWLDRVFAEFQRVLKPNGSMYVFASPRMAARVEVLAAQRFNVLNRITWAKPDPSSAINYGAGNGGRISKEIMRRYYPNTEAIIFAEHYGADNIAKGEAGYAAKCDELRGFVFEPLRAYLDGERMRAGVTVHDVDCAMYPIKARRYFNVWSDEWRIPTQETYNQLRRVLHQLNHGGEYLQRPYEELRQQYEELRRPFSVSPDVPYTDVWTFPTVSTYAGKHPTEKPLSLMRHIVRTSSKPGATVLDAFTGSGTTGVVCDELGRNFVGVELSPEYCRIAERRIGLVNVQPALVAEHA